MPKLVSGNNNCCNVKFPVTRYLQEHEIKTTLRFKQMLDWSGAHTFWLSDQEKKCIWPLFGEMIKIHGQPKDACVFDTFGVHILRVIFA